MAETVEIGGVAADEIIAQQEVVGLLGRELTEHAIDLAEVAGERQQLVAIGRETGPLGVVLLRRVPDERIAHRCIGDGDVVGDDMIGSGPQIEPGQPVEDHAHRIEPADAPSLGGERSLDQDVVAGIPARNVGAELGLVALSAMAGDIGGEAAEFALVGEDMADRQVDVGEKRLEVDDRRSAIDAPGRAADLDLPGVASRAGHRQAGIAALASREKADRKAVPGIGIVEIAVAQHAVRREARSIGTLERHEPGQRHDPRSLIAGIEVSALSGGPLRALVEPVDGRPRVLGGRGHAPCRCGDGECAERRPTQHADCGFPRGRFGWHRLAPPSTALHLMDVSCDGVPPNSEDHDGLCKIFNRECREQNDSKIRPIHAIFSAPDDRHYLKVIA